MAFITKKQIAEKLQDSLYLNSIFLILTMGAMAGFGFIFWLINARLFSAHDIGIATAIIPTTTIIAIASLLGLDNSTVRFLHTKNNKAKFIRSAFFLVSTTAIICSLLFGFLSFLFSPTISSFFSNKINYTIFTVLSATTTLNLLSDAIYLANKKTVFTFTITTFHSFLRSIFPFLFISYGTSGILLAAALAQMIGLIINLYVLNTKWQYFRNVSISLLSLSGIWKYTTHNYVASLFTLLPYSIVPIIIIERIGTADSAYYYIVMMIANFLYVIPSATTRSLFAEGSHNETDIKNKIIKSVNFILLFTIPTIIVLLLSARFILHFFGNDYAMKGAYLLQILVLTVIPYAIYSIANAIFKIKNKSHYLLICTAFLSVAEVFFVYCFISNGLDGIGYAVLLSNTLAALLSSGLCLLMFLTNDK